MTTAETDLLERLRALGDGLGPAGAGRGTSQSPSAPGGAETRGDRGDGAPRARTLRVSVETLDRLLDLAGEIAVGRGRLQSALEDAGGATPAPALEIHRDADRLHSELQELVMKARMEPLGPTLRRFARTVRDLGSALGKSVQLLVEGDDVEVDTKVIENVRDPLTHLVRNAVAHGIESPATRAERGKASRGLVRLRAYRDTGGIVIEVEDDGAGLSKERIAHRARERGLLAEGQALGDREIQALIFEPGFSTANHVTEVSGRGVGLDVVQRNVEALRGSVSVSTREGQGTTFTLRLPLSLSIIPGFGVTLDGLTFILPLEAVQECLELPPGTLGGRDETGMVGLRGQPLPCRRLRRRFEMPGEVPAREFVVVVHYDGRRIGLVVDALLGESQTVLKPLGPALRGLPGIAGTAILDNGRVALVVDLPRLFREAA